MKEMFFSKTGCRCILQLQAKEDLKNNRCMRCQTVTKLKAKYEAEKRKESKQ